MGLTNCFRIPPKNASDEVVWAIIGSPRTLHLRARIIKQARSDWARWAKEVCEVCDRPVGFGVEVYSATEDDGLSHKNCHAHTKEAS